MFVFKVTKNETSANFKDDTLISYCFIQSFGFATYHNLKLYFWKISSLEESPKSVYFKTFKS